MIVSKGFHTASIPLGVSARTTAGRAPGLDGYLKARRLHPAGVLREASIGVAWSAIAPARQGRQSLSCRRHRDIDLAGSKKRM